MNAFLECFRGPLKTLWQAHRRTRQGFGGAAAAPGLKNFRANFVFQGKRKLLKTPENKKYIFSTVNLGHPLLFRASASCSKLLNVKSIFNTVKKFRATLFFRASASCSKTLNYKNISIEWYIPGKLCLSGQAQVVQNSWMCAAKNFRATLFFQGKRKLLKYPEW